jgi:dipeptide transport system substrate-binding protein
MFRYLRVDVLVRFDPVRKDVVGYRMDATAHHFFSKVDMTGP